MRLIGSADGVSIANIAIEIIAGTSGTKSDSH
jgi:hypothetical protein